MVQRHARCDPDLAPGADREGLVVSSLARKRVRQLVPIPVPGRHGAHHRLRLVVLRYRKFRRLVGKAGTRACDTSSAAPSATTKAAAGRRAGSGRLQRESDTESKNVGTEGGVGTAAIGGAREIRMVVPAAAPQDTHAAGFGKPRAAVRRGPVVSVDPPAVLGPLPDVPVYVIETPRVRCEAAHGRCLRCVPLAAASVAVGPVRADLVAPMEYCFRTRARRVLPLGLARQAVFLARLLRKPRHIRLRVVPAHAYDRTIAAAPAPVVRTIAVAAPRIHASVPLLERHLVAGQREARNVYVMYRKLAEIAPPAVVQAAHAERSFRNLHHRRALTTGGQRVRERRERLAMGGSGAHGRDGTQQRGGGRSNQYLVPCGKSRKTGTLLKSGTAPCRRPGMLRPCGRHHTPTRQFSLPPNRGQKGIFAEKVEVSCDVWIHSALPTNIMGFKPSTKWRRK